MTQKWITKKRKDGKIRHIPINESNRMREREIKPKENTLDQKIKHLIWYKDIEEGYTDMGIDEAVIYKTGLDYKGKIYEITVYPMNLISEEFQDDWEYRIYELNKNGEIIDEYDAGAENEHHFSSPDEAKKGAIVTLKEALEEDR
jgi:hypothetical protein